MNQADNLPEISSQSAELFHLIVENVKDYAIFMMDKEGIVVSWNPGVERLLGYAESEFIGQPVAIIFIPEDAAADAPAKEMKTAAQAGCSEDKRWHLRKDGSRFWANGMLMQLKADDGTLRGFAKVMRDDTVQRLSEEKLVQSTRRVDDVLSSISDSFYTFDREFRYVYVNEATTEMFGMPESAFLGKTLWELFPDVEGNTFHAEVQRAFNEQRKIIFENYYSPIDRWFENRIYPSPDGLSVFTTEITTRKRAEVALRESEKRYRLLFESIDEGFCVVEVMFDDSEKPVDYRFLEINPSFEKLTGILAVEALREKSVRKLVPNLEEKWFEIYGRVALTGEPARFVEGSEAMGRWFDVYAFRIGDPAQKRVAILFENITERKESEKTLRNAEERYRALIEATATTVWHATPEGALSFVGAVWTEVSGQSVEEILKWGWLDALHPDDREHTIEVWQAALRNKTLYSTEFRVMTVTGEYRWFAVNAVPIFNTDGSVREWVGLNTDITERKKSEELLRQSEQKFSALAEGVSQFVWMAEPDGFIFWYNRNWYDYTGTTPEDMQGWGWQSVHDPAMLPQVMEKWQASLQTGKKFEMEFPIKGADGIFRWFLTRVNPLRNAEGQIIRWFGTNTEIDVQRRLGERNRFILEIDEAVRPLETAEEITLTLARLLGEYLGVDRCAYAEVEADEDHFYIPGDYTKGDMHSIVGRYSMADFGAVVLQRMRENQPYVVSDVDNDEQVTEADLAAYRLTSIQSVICVPLHKNGKFSACMAVHQKVPRRWLPEEVELVSFVANRFWESIERARTVKKLHESLVRETEARSSAENANRLKDDFLATLSHELRTPLNAILGWSQILSSRSLGEKETKKALVTIERNARSQTQLIDDLLDVSRIITGKLRLNIRAVDLPHVITAAIDAVRPAAEAKNIRLQTLLDPQAVPISGDPDRLQQVIWNLLSNAVKFTPKEGRVQIRLERINSHVEIVVSDTGKGIAPEFLPHVFDRFRQSDGSMTRRHGGLGLGLAIVRQLIELHGGTVSANSGGDEQGATFTVSLPLLPVRREPTGDLPRVNPAAQTETETDCPPQLNGLRVLLVDDEADSRDLLNVVLDSCGAEVSTASSAAEALKMIQSAKFDVMVSDIGMPDEDGFSLIGKIRNLPDEQGGSVPAIALTAYARAEDRMQALRSGFQMHLAKPVEPDELIVVIANLAGKIDWAKRTENQ